MKINYTTASTSTFKPLYVAKISYSSNEKELSVNLMNKLIQKSTLIRIQFKWQKINWKKSLNLQIKFKDGVNAS